MAVAAAVVVACWAVFAVAVVARLAVSLFLSLHVRRSQFSFLVVAFVTCLCIVIVIGDIKMSMVMN